MTLYVGETCPKCKIAEKIAGEDVKITSAEDNLEKFREHNINTVPVLELDDGTWISDFTQIMNILKGEETK